MGEAAAMRFAVQLKQPEPGWDWTTTCRWAEAEGFDVLSAADHLTGQLAPLLGLAAAAAVTTTVGLSTFVIAIGMRHLGMLAKEAATLDALSGGRLEIGLGAGWAKAEYDAIGLPFPRPADRIAELAEAVTVLRRLWRGETVSSGAGRHRLEHYRVTPQPPRAEGIPIVIGGGGPTTLALAGREADVASIAPAGAATRTTQSELGDHISWEAVRGQVSTVLDAARNRPSPPRLHLQILSITPGASRHEAAQRVAADRGSDQRRVLDSPFLLLGPTDAMVEHLERIHQELGVSYVTVSQRDMHQAVPVMARLRS